jgi:hypothetical protein
MELVACWVLGQPYLAFEEGSVFARNDARGAALSAEAARVPWSISSRPNRLWLSVGPIALEPGALEPALELYHCYRHLLALQLPARATRAADFELRSGAAVSMRGPCAPSPSAPHR